MSIDNSYLYYALDQLSPLGQITYRRMFGGYGLYNYDLIFAFIANDELFFKVDDTNRCYYENAGSEPFTYRKNDKEYQMSYWKIPEEVLEDSDELRKWMKWSYKISLKQKK